MEPLHKLAHLGHHPGAAAFTSNPRSERLPRDRLKARWQSLVNRGGWPIGVSRLGAALQIRRTNDGFWQDRPFAISRATALNLRAGRSVVVWPRGGPEQEDEDRQRQFWKYRASPGVLEAPMDDFEGAIAFAGALMGQSAQSELFVPTWRADR